MMKGRWSEWWTLQTKRLWPWVVVLLCVIITGARGESGPQDEDLFQYKHPPTDGPHKALWPLDKHDYITMACATLGLIVAAGGGIGGGGILVPLFILVLKFEPKRAVPLSNVTILGGAIANTVFGLMSRHPIADRPLPDWSLILMMEPTTIVGAVCGSFLNKVLPGIVISILLVVVLGALAHRTLKKGIKQLHKEGGCQRLGVECGSASSSRESSVVEGDSRCSSVARGEFKDEAPLVGGVGRTDGDGDVEEGEKPSSGNERQALLRNDVQHVSYASTETHRTGGLITPAAPLPVRSSWSHDRQRTPITDTHTHADTDSEPPPRSHSVTIPPRHHRGQHMRRRSGYVPVEILSTRSPHPTHFNLVNVFSVHSPLLSDNDGVTGEEEDEVVLDGCQTHLGTDGPAAEGQGKLGTSASWAGKLNHTHMVTLPSDMEGRVSTCAGAPEPAVDEVGTVDAAALGAAGKSGRQANGEHAHTQPSACITVEGRDGCHTSDVAPPRPVVEEGLVMVGVGEQRGPLGRRPLGISLRARLIDIDRYVPVWKPVVLTVCFLGIVILDILKGGRGRSPLGFNCGSVAYWVVTLATIPWVLCFFVVIRKAILREHAAKRAADYPFVEGDIVWTPSSTIKFPCLCISAGLFAGIFGVGGGIVKGPLMLEMGVLPPVAAASAATMILYTSAAATVAFYIFGLIPVDYAAFFFVWGIFCTVMGQLLINHLLRRYKSESFIVLSIGVVILLSAVLMAFQALTNFLHHPHDIARFPGLCGSD